MRVNQRDGESVRGTHGIYFGRSGMGSSDRNRWPHAGHAWYRIRMELVTRVFFTTVRPCVHWGHVTATYSMVCIADLLYRQFHFRPTGVPTVGVQSFGVPHRQPPFRQLVASQVQQHK